MRGGKGEGEVGSPPTPRVVEEGWNLREGVY